VKAISGQVLLNRGDGYKLVAGQADAGVGATVVSNPGATAQIIYPDGCVVDVKPITVATISPQSPCNSGSSSAGLSSGTSPLVLGAAAVGVGVGAALLIGQKDSSASGQ
jgi:hypothetical protein